MQRTAALLGAAALLVAACGVAHANPDSPADQQKFFDSVKRQGLSGPQDAELSLGRQVCTLVKLGCCPALKMTMTESLSVRTNARNWCAC